MIGCFIVFAVCGFSGFSAAEMNRTRVGQLRAFLDFIRYAKAQIDFYRMPLSDIFKGFAKSENVISTFISEAEKEGAVNALRSQNSSLYLRRDDADLLEGFFADLGKHGIHEEKKHCEYYENQLSQTLSAAEKELIGKVKLCRCVGFLFGAVTAILLF